MFKIENLTESARESVCNQIAESWGAVFIVTRGILHDTRLLEGFVAMENGTVAGYALYKLSDGECELVVLESLSSAPGIGSALINTVLVVARDAKSRRLWLITTNDNTHAIRFYQKRGFELRAVHINAMDEARLLKPQIPQTGEDGIPIKHEFEFEIML